MRVFLACVDRARDTPGHTVPLQGRGARAEFGVSKTGSNRETIVGLEGDGHVVADDHTRTG